MYEMPMPLVLAWVPLKQDKLSSVSIKSFAVGHRWNIPWWLAQRDAAAGALGDGGRCQPARLRRYRTDGNLVAVAFIFGKRNRGEQENLCPLGKTRKYHNDNNTSLFDCARVWPRVCLYVGTPGSLIQIKGHYKNNRTLVLGVKSHTRGTTTMPNII